ncbi:MAG: O-antigen ligase family protein [Chloroflexi bacterium]|nr:O-antigen ligase family protein [Chloroflexota bacterium]
MTNQIRSGGTYLRLLAVPIALVLPVAAVIAAGVIGWEYVIGAIALLSLVTAGLTDTRWIILSILAVFAINHTSLIGGSPATQIARWLVLGFAAVVALLRILSDRPPRRFHSFDLLAIMFLALCLASTSYSSDPSLTFQRAVSLVLLYLAVFWLGWDYANRDGSEAVVRLLIISATLIFGASALYAFFPAAWQSNGRFMGVLPNPNTISLLVVTYLPLLIWGTFKYRSFWTLMVLIVAATALVLSQSRNGLISAAFGVVFLLWQVRPKRLVAIVSIALPILVIVVATTSIEEIVLGAPVIGRFLDNAGGDISSGRFQSWGSVLAQIQVRPLFGHGFGIDSLGLVQWSPGVTQFVGVHNTYLQILYQVGLVGVAFAFGPLLALLGLSLTRSGIEELRLEHVLLTVLASGLVAAIFENWIFAVGNAFAFPFWICVMLLLRVKWYADGVS